MNQNNWSYISWEQAVQFNVLKPTAEKYQEMLRESYMFFVSNTIYQMTHMDLMMRCGELLGYYIKKDYSKFLFDETEIALKAVAEVKKEGDESQVVEKMRKFAKMVTETTNKIIEVEKNGSFIMKCANNLCALEDIDDYIDRWHEGESEQPIYHYLGMSEREYADWIKDHNQLAIIVKRRVDDIKLMKDSIEEDK